MATRALVLASMLAASVCLLAACSSGGLGQAGAGSTATPPSSATTSRGSATSASSTTSTVGTTAPTATSLPLEQQQVFDAYKASLDAFDAALHDPPNPDEPSLAQRMVDPMLTKTRNLAAEWRGFGQAGRYPDKSIRRVVPIKVTITGDTASIESCSVDDGIVYEPATGKVLNDAVSTAEDKATLRLVDGTWKLSTKEQLQKWQGVAGCAVDS